MPQTLWIVRHGNRVDFLDNNWHKTAARPHDPALSPDGEQQASELGRGFQQYSVDRIFASPFLRTLQTASHVADVLDLPIHAEPGLSETLPNLSEPPALLTRAERLRQFPQVDPDYEPVYRPTYPESEETAHQRIADTIQTLADKTWNSNLLFVSHASPIAGALRNLLGSTDQFKVPLCAIFTLERQNQDASWILVGKGDISHLSEQQVSLRHAHVG